MLRSKNQLILLIGFAAFIALGILAYLFFLQRTVYTDLAFHTVHLLVEKKLFIQNNRFGAMFTQAFPLAAHQLHWPLKSILIAYSESFIIYFAALFLLCSFWLKQYKWALIMVLLPLFISTHTFYWAQSELPQGLAMLIFTCAYIAHIANLPAIKWHHYMLLFIFIVFLVFFHPLLIFPVSFIAAFFFLKHSNKTQQKNIAWVLGTFLVLLILQKLFIHSGYDRSAMGRLKYILLLFPNYINLPSNKWFIKSCVQHYYLLPIAFIAVCWRYWAGKQIKLLALFVLFVPGYLFMVNVSCYNTTSPAYIENMYYPLVLMVIIPLVFDVLWNIKSSTVFALLLVTALTLRLTDIALANTPYTARLNFKNNLLAKTAQLPHKKLLIDNTVVKMDTLETWASADEFLLLSALQHPDSVRCIFVDNHLSKKLSDWAPANYEWASKWYYINYRQFDSTLFHFTDYSDYVVVDSSATLY